VAAVEWNEAASEDGVLVKPVLAVYLKHRGAGSFGCFAAGRCLVLLDSCYALPSIKKCVDTYAQRGEGAESGFLRMYCDLKVSSGIHIRLGFTGRSSSADTQDLLPLWGEVWGEESIFSLANNLKRSSQKMPLN
ncbi:hypothetical protein, partial [Pseudomonas fluorescens]|uniref:hypothetical protein n=1 Tax=Pseudomonas fluorescens TaxID=294 RepID=UPI001CD5CDAF